MIYQVRHRTTYRYDQPVTYARCSLRLTPRDTADQSLIEHAISIWPKPARISQRTGPFGEQVTAVLVETPHRELRVESNSRVQVRRMGAGREMRGAPWESVRDAATASVTLDISGPAHFLYPTAMTPILGPITAYARQCFPAGRPIVEAAFALTRAIHADFDYDPKATEVSTPAIEAFAARRGVCQDFSHIMLSGLRGLGLACAYVSGYLRTQPPPGKPRLEGADATHAWVALWCGEALGWIGFDPTNGIVVSDDHIELALGRDYSDVAPIDGIILASGDQSLTVGVDVTPLTETSDATGVEAFL